MRKLLSVSVLAALLIMLVASTTAFAEMPKGTLVMKNKAYSLNYAAMAESYNEILQAFQDAGYTLYYKNFAGNWEDSMGNTVQKTSIPEVTYKDVGKEPVNYAAGDGEIVTSAMATVNYSFSRPGFLYTANVTVNGDDLAAKYAFYDEAGAQVSDIKDLGTEVSLAPVVAAGSQLYLRIMDANQQVLASQLITVVDGPGSCQYEIVQDKEFKVIDIY
jgi:hypothetical protein